MKNKDDEKNNDAGNRGIIEVKGKAAPKKILILIILLIAALFVIISCLKFFHENRSFSKHLLRSLTRHWSQIPTMAFH